MADVYVDENAGGSDDGTSWANAYPTLAAALTGSAVAGNIYWVAHDHDETTASAVTLTSPGTSATPCRIFCVDKTGTNSAADLRTTAIIKTTGSLSHFNIAGVAYCYGITFQSGDGTNAAGIRWTSGYWKHKNCKFVLNNNNVSSWINPANPLAVRTEWEDCTVKFGAVTQGITFNGMFTWYATAGGSAIDVAGSIPTNLFMATTSGIARCRGLDFSALTSGKNLVGANASGVVDLMFENCRIHADTTKIVVPTVNTSESIVMSRVAATGLNYTFDKKNFCGTESAEITIVRTPGASDGTTAVAKKIETTGSRITHPFEAMPIPVWNEEAGAPLDITIEGTWGDGSVPTNSEIWMEVEYPGSASYPISHMASTAPVTCLTAPTSYAAGSGSWGGGTTPFAMTVTITPEMVGWITVRIKAALTGKTFYIDPKVVIS